MPIHCPAGHRDATFREGTNRKIAGRPRRRARHVRHRSRPNGGRGPFPGMSRSVPARCDPRSRRARSAAGSAGDGVAETDGGRRDGAGAAPPANRAGPPPQDRPVRPRLPGHRRDRHPTRSSTIHRSSRQPIRKPAPLPFRHRTPLSGAPRPCQQVQQTGGRSPSSPRKTCRPYLLGRPKLAGGQMRTSSRFSCYWGKTPRRTTQTRARRSQILQVPDRPTNFEVGRLDRPTAMGDTAGGGL